MTKIKAIIFDVDGVLNIGSGEYFSVRYARESGTDIDIINEFFQDKFKQCSVGLSDLKEELEETLYKWNWTGTVDEFLDKWFREESNKNDELIRYSINLRSRGYPIYIATQQERYRKQYIWHQMGMSEIFEKIYSTCEAGMLKNDPRFFDRIIDDLDISADEIVFWDDKQSIVDIAKSTGINAFRYESFESFKEKMDNII